MDPSVHPCRGPALGAVPGLKYLCPPDAALARLRERSVRYKQGMYRDYLLPPSSSRNATGRAHYLAGVEAEHRKSFAQYMERRMFCNWDVEFLLESNATVREWFQNQSL